MTKTDRDALIVSAVLTSIGKFGGAFKGLRAYQLAGAAMSEALRRAGIEPASLDEVIAGECVQAPDEAFAAQYLACERGLGLDRDRVNVNGSGLGLWHPVGWEGA